MTLLQALALGETSLESHFNCFNCFHLIWSGCVTLLRRISRLLWRSRALLCHRATGAGADGAALPRTM